MFVLLLCTWTRAAATAAPEASVTCPVKVAVGFLSQPLEMEHQADGNSSFDVHRPFDWYSLP